MESAIYPTTRTLERLLHTHEVAGSSPAAPTTFQQLAIDSQAVIPCAYSACGHVTLPERCQNAAVSVPLTRGMSALVDLEDYDRVAALKWYAHCNGTNWYAARGSAQTGRVWLHHFIWGEKTKLDHINGDGTDCRKENLRPCTTSQNNANRRARIGPSGFRGVRGCSPGRWCAQIKHHHRVHRLGTFPTAEEAARAYDTAAVEHFGEFARLNFQNDRTANSGGFCGGIAGANG